MRNHSVLRKSVLFTKMGMILASMISLCISGFPLFPVSLCKHPICQGLLCLVKGFLSIQAQRMRFVLLDQRDSLQWMVHKISSTLTWLFCCETLGLLVSYSIDIIYTVHQDAVCNLSGGKPLWRPMWSQIKEAK